MVNLLLIRHGETESNKQNIIMGQTQVPLNSRGKIEAKLCGDYLIKNFTNISAIYSSTLIRAQETAKIIAEVLNFKNEIIYLPALAERSFGELTGFSYKDVEVKLRNKDGTKNLYLQPPNGESYIEFYTRAKNAMEFILNGKNYNEHETVIILSHGGTLGHILGYLLDGENKIYNDFPIALRNCSISHLKVSKNVNFETRVIFINFYQYLECFNKS